MGIDHGKKIKTPLRKPKAIDEIGQKKKPAFDIMKEFNKTMENFKKFEQQRKAKKASKKAGESSKKTTITDTQKRGQIGLRYDLFEGRKRPLKKPTAKKVSPGSKSRKESRDSKPKNFLPHKIQQKLPTVRDAVYTFPEGKKPKFLRKKTSGSA
jgi:hypothetical protein